MLRILLGALFGLVFAAQPSLAEPTALQKSKVAALWLIAFDDWGPILTCGATNPPSDVVVRNAWENTRTSALAAMQSAGWPADDLALLEQKSAADALRLPPDTAFDDLVAYCERHQDWVERSFRLDAIPIGAEVAKILN